MKHLTNHLFRALALGAFIVALGGFSAGCSDDEEIDNLTNPDPRTPSTLAETVAGNPDFSTLLVAVEAAGLTSTLQEGGPFTVFAPTNAAFAKIDTMTLNALLNDQTALANVILYHVVPGTVESGDVATLLNSDVETAYPGNTIRIESTTEGVGIKVNDSVITAVDIEASNGVIHVIDTVLLP